MRYRSILLAAASVCLAACATQTITPSYTTTNPHIQIGGERPVDGAPQIEHAGSFCLEVVDKWHQDGKTPDGTALWAQDTFRKVVPCP